MKIENIYIKPDGQICACVLPVPDKPQFSALERLSPATQSECNKIIELHEQALKACKESAVLFDNQEAATRKFGNILFGHITINNIDRYKNHYFEKDTFYPLQCSIHIVEQKRYRMSYQKNDWTDWTCEVPDWVIPSIEYETRKVARLIPEAPCQKCGGTGTYLVGDFNAHTIECDCKKVSHNIRGEYSKHTTPLEQTVAKVPEAKGHGFCEKSGHVCTMNSCDENGCQERKRVLVPEAPAPSDFKTARKFERFTAKDKESIAPIVEESQEDIAVKFAMYMCGKTSLGDEDWFRRTFKNNHWNVKITRKP